MHLALRGMYQYCLTDNGVQWTGRELNSLKSAMNIAYRLLSSSHSGSQTAATVILCSKALTTNACESVWLACHEGKNKAPDGEETSGFQCEA